MSDSYKYTAKREILWKINNVTRETLKNGVTLHSSDFKVLLGLNEIKWCLEFRCDDNIVYFFLTRKTLETDNFTAYQELDIYKPYGFYDIRLYKKCDESKVYTKNKCVGWSWKIENFRSFLDDHRYFFSNRNVLKFSLKLTLRQKRRQIKIVESNELLRNTKLFNSIKDSDFTCISSDGKEFPVHSKILASQSPVFDKMFNADMSETKTKTVKIDDIDGDTFLEFLRFIYTGQVENLEDMVSSLIYVADKYEIIKLKKLCTESLMKNLSIGNASETLILADRFNENFLLYECIQIIIRSNHNFRSNKSLEQNIKELIDFELVKKVMDINDIIKENDKIIEFNSTL
ncbi:hypothetical protein PVAND_006148 [Polypedilum vanderplanki]|uniref:BTB domain-containing protein n=1 Tax=Polypedilum vanderplanki TaxID=319348 RepID=A0A9J6C331_POLVA|nr:hypothetical protein PVAND_006148 [Polypedilum vanderplanki]